MKKVSIVFLFTAMLFATISCDNNNDEQDITPPKTVSDLTATPMNGAVKILWTNPLDEDYTATIIKYGDIEIELIAGETEKLIEGLTNGIEYTFNFSTKDLVGNISEAVSIKATPDKFVTVVDGSVLSNGTYDAIDSSFPIQIVLTGNQYKKTMSAGNNQYLWEGNWLMENDTTFKFNFEYRTISNLGNNHVANLVERITNAMIYTYKDTTIYIENTYLKVEGSDSLLAGKYRRYIKTISDDKPSYNDTTYYYVNISNDGVVEYNDSDNNTSSSAWTNDDLLDGRFLFISYNSKTYLVIRDKMNRYMKK